MRLKSLYIFFVLVGCDKASVELEPLYTLAEPLIEFKSLELRRSKRTDEPDTLRLQLVMKDGDHDLGLNSFPLDPPYHYANAIIKSNGNKVDLSKLTADQANQVIRYRDRKTPPYDTLPRFVAPYDCRSWDVRTIVNKVDTIYKQLNPYFNNIDVDFLIESANGTFQVFDFGIFPYPQCANTFSGRFPWTDFKGPYSQGPFKFSLLSISSGTLTYNIQSVGFHAPIWSPKKVKLRVSIVDRAFHRSNVIETDVVQL